MITKTRYDLTSIYYIAYPFMMSTKYYIYGLNMQGWQRVNNKCINPYTFRWQAKQMFRDPELVKLIAIGT